MMIRRSVAFSRMDFTLPSLLQQKQHRDPADEKCHPEVERGQKMTILRDETMQMYFMIFGVISQRNSALFGLVI